MASLLLDAYIKTAKNIRRPPNIGEVNIRLITPHIAKVIASLFGHSFLSVRKLKGINFPVRIFFFWIFKPHSGQKEAYSSLTMVPQDGHFSKSALGFNIFSSHDPQCLHLFANIGTFLPHSGQYMLFRSSKSSMCLISEFYEDWLLELPVYKVLNNFLLNTNLYKDVRF